jgi:hypothetical protein
MKTSLFLVFFGLFGAAANAQKAPNQTVNQHLQAAKTAEEAEQWEKAEAEFAFCLAQAPADTALLQSHAYASVNSLLRRPNSTAPDYMALAVRDYDALIAAGKVRYLLQRATAYGLRAESTTDQTEARRLLDKALQDVASYEAKLKPNDESRTTRRALLDAKGKLL